MLTPGDSLQVPVTFAPTAAGAFERHVPRSAPTMATAQRDQVALTGSGARRPVRRWRSPAAGGWALNGSAAMTASTLTLTASRRR